MIHLCRRSAGSFISAATPRYIISLLVCTSPSYDSRARIHRSHTDQRMRNPENLYREDESSQHPRNIPTDARRSSLYSRNQIIKCLPFLFVKTVSALLWLLVCYNLLFLACAIEGTVLEWNHVSGPVYVGKHLTDSIYPDSYIQGVNVRTHHGSADTTYLVLVGPPPMS
jgi:hypothetical protein